MQIKIIFMVAIVSEMATAGIRIRKKKVFGLPEKSGQNLPEQSGQRIRPQRQPEMKAPQCEFVIKKFNFRFETFDKKLYVLYDCFFDPLMTLHF
jgi:hypothetical protein